MGEQFYTNKQQMLNIQQIVLGHLKQILQICCGEFRSGYTDKKPVTSGAGGYWEIIYHEDKRDAYINAVNALADLLLPYYDKIMKEDVEKIEGEMEAKRKRYEEKKVRKDEWISEKQEVTRGLFRKLNLLLHRKDYLKTAPYTEIDAGEEVEED